MSSRRGALAAVAAALVPILGLTIGFPVAGDPAPAVAPFLCLLCGSRGTADFLLNVALFVPLGVALRMAGFRTATALLLGLALSGLLESVQMWIPGRHTTLGDLAANTLGAGLGARAATLTRSSLRLQIAATAVVAGTWLAGAALFTVSLPTTAYYGQWTAELGQYEGYGGQVLEARLGDLPLPSWRLHPEGAARSALLTGDTLTVTALAGPPPTGPAPIFSVYDDRQTEILFLGADGRDLVLKIRTRARDLRLGNPALRWRGAFGGVTPGDTVRLAVWRQGPSGMCARVDADEWCRAPGAARGWMLLLDPGWVPPGLRGVADAAWIGSTAALALAWAPGLGAGMVGAGVLALALLASSAV